MQVIVNVPDQFLLDTSVGEIARQFKLYAALFMFQAGQLSAGAACEFAEIDRYAFIEACKRYHIPVIDYDEDELVHDFEELKRTCASCFIADSFAPVRRLFQASDAHFFFYL